MPTPPYFQDMFAKGSPTHNMLATFPLGHKTPLHAADDDTAYCYNATTQLLSLRQDVDDWQGTVGGTAVIGYYRSYAFFKSVGAGGFHQFGLIVGGNLYVKASFNWSPSYWAGWTMDWTTNPATGNAWQESELDDVVLHYQSQALAGGEMRIGYARARVYVTAITPPVDEPILSRRGITTTQLAQRGELVGDAARRGALVSGIDQRGETVITIARRGFISTYIAKRGGRINGD